MAPSRGVGGGRGALRVGVLAALLGLAAEAAAAAEGREVALEIVAVEVGAAEDNGLLHLERLHLTDQRVRNL